jgi:hypothetical protein
LKTESHLHWTIEGKIRRRHTSPEKEWKFRFNRLEKYIGKPSIWNTTATDTTDDCYCAGYHCGLCPPEPITDVLLGKNDRGSSAPTGRDQPSPVLAQKFAGLLVVSVALASEKRRDQLPLAAIRLHLPNQSAFETLQATH